MILTLLFDGVNIWCDLNSIRYVYFETSKPFLRYVNKLGWPFAQVGKAHTFQPANVVTVAGLLDRHTLSSR